MQETSVTKNNSLSDAQFMQGVYMWMCSGLVVTALVAYLVSISPQAIDIIFGTPFVFYGLIIAEFIAVIYFLTMITKVRSSTAVLIFLTYALLNGLTFAAIFLSFTIASIGITFAVTAGMFGIMSVYGYITKTDLTTIGNIAFMGLIGIILASILNFFFHSEAVDYIISYLGVLVFTALTSYDTQKIKNYNSMGKQSTEDNRKKSIVGALSLYLDFVNLFLMLLRFFGKRR
jgi:uncharacterized protein